MQIRECSVQDARELAVLNRRLIEDEQSDNPMGPDELENRMREFLSDSYTAYFFEDGGTAVGYALVRQDVKPLYLRQFYIDRDFRRKHYGRDAFHALMTLLGPKEITVDVLPWNRAGLAFWRSLGFSETCVSMKYTKADS